TGVQTCALPIFIEPMQVRRSNGELLLIAHCQLRNDRRTFKLDRIVQLTKVERGAPIVVSVGVEHVPCDAPVETDVIESVSEVSENTAPTEVGGPAESESTSVVESHG